MIDSLLTVLYIAAIVSTILSLLWNIRLWAIAFNVLAMLLFLVAGISAANTLSGDNMFFDYGTIVLASGMILINMLLFFVNLGKDVTEVLK